jgi:hypothetical protein
MKHVGLGLGRVAYAVLAVSVMGCGASGDDATGRSDESVVCAACQVAGGETSDFGSHPEPPPCHRSEALVPLTEAEARELGFDVGLDLFARTVTTSYAWSLPLGDSLASATGYTESTDVELTTSIASVEHLVPALAGCEDRLLVHVNAELATADGSLTVSGQLRSVIERQPQAVAYGSLDLTTATGTLRVTPPDWDVPALGYVLGYVGIGVQYWPETTRGTTSIGLFTADARGELDSSAEALIGRFPVDSCDVNAVPVSVDEVLPGLGGRSTNDVRDELAALLASKQPTAATWSSGAQTEVTATLGSPSWACKSDRLSTDGTHVSGLGYVLPLTIESADGRVHIAAEARASVQVDAEGAFTSAWFEIYDHVVVPVQDLATTAGISGVSFGDVPQAHWHTAIYPIVGGTAEPHGKVTVEGVSAEGRAVDDALEELTWSLE